VPSYAEPFARVALPAPVRAVGAGARFEHQQPGIRLAGVGTRWGIY
jgi:hypothetical protein